MISSQHHAPLLHALMAIAHQANAPFYTPGHKRGQGASPLLITALGRDVFRLDLPELPELDNLFAPQGAIQEAQQLAAQTFGADETWFLVNGSTCGIEAAILAVCRPGEKIILPRNVHQSAIAALILSGAVPIFVQPEWNAAWGIAHSITPQAVAAALNAHPDARAIFMVSPTYHGVCGDVAAIAHLAHERQIPLIVDEAHGPHFAFHPDLPTPALVAGADVSVQSIHKVLGALTQASMLHRKGELVNGDRLQQALTLVQSTSPSYLLLASLDGACQQMALQGRKWMEQTLALAEDARARLRRIPGINLLAPPPLVGPSPGFVEGDRTRLTLDVRGLGITGYEADEILHQELGVTAELPSLHHLTFIVSLGNTPQDIDQLITGVTTLSHRCQPPGVKSPLHELPAHGTGYSPTNHCLPAVLTPREAFFAPTEIVPVQEAIDRISAECLCPYPPGIPVVIPGERITQAALEGLRQAVDLGGMVTGGADPQLGMLRVISCHEIDR